jgi:rhodanese-related sulfurtransferase
MKTLIILSLFVFSTIQSQTVNNVDAATFKKLIESHKGELIDLRTYEEIVAKGKIKGAIEIDFLAKDIETTIGKLDKKKTYLIYCAGGGRSGDCAEMMQKMNFISVYNLEKGFGDWKNKGFEIEKK